MKTLIKRILEATRKYTIMDYACLKIALLSLGIILGAYLSQFFLNYTSFLWVVYIASFLWILFRTFLKHMD